MSLGFDRRCEKCGGQLDREELKSNAKRCSLCRDSLKGEDYVTAAIGFIAGGALCAIAFNNTIAMVAGSVAGALLGRVVQKYLDAKRKLELIRGVDEAGLSLPEIERRRKLEAEKTLPTDRRQ